MTETVVLPPDSPLGGLVNRSPTLVVFLRHFGCTFCRQTMAEVGELRPRIESSGTLIAFVHPESVDAARPWFERFGLSDVLQVSDPSLKHYVAFGLGNMRMSALLSPSVWARGASAAASYGFGYQPPGLLRQLGGAFVVRGDRILGSFRHHSSADRPDYLDLVSSSLR
ncbi:MAG: SelL-related redox protein [Vicinamibacterales bacterium]